jgi:hypothetical protein
MTYGVEFAPPADEAISSLPPLVASGVLDGIDRLAEDPVRLSRPSHFPYRPGRQMYQFWVEAEGTRWWITVFFRYAQDEERIVILDLAAQSMSP